MKKLLLLIFILTSTFACADEIVEKKQELKAIYDKLSQKKATLKETRIKEQNVLRQLTYLQSKIDKNTEKLNYAKYLLRKSTIELKKVTKDLYTARKQLDQNKGLLRKRLREIYKTWNVQWLELIFTFDKFSDFVNDTYYFEKLINRDILLIESIFEQKKKIEKQKELVDKKKKQVEDNAASIISEKQELELNKARKEKLKRLLELKRKQYEKEIRELENNSQEIEKLVKNLLDKKRAVLGSGTFIWPVKGWISSPYGYREHPIFKTVKFHSGIDIVAVRGTRIKAADSGVVIYSGRFGGYGKTVIIDHGRGFSSVYAHQSRIMVKKDQKVEKGQIIGLVGSTGYSTGPHLHFEVRKGGKVVEPMGYLTEE